MCPAGSASGWPSPRLWSTRPRSTPSATPSPPSTTPPTPRCGPLPPPARARVAPARGLGVLGVPLAVLGRGVLGGAPDVISAGVVGSRSPAGTTKEQAVEAMRQRGDGKIADMLSRMDIVPGRGIDFGHLGRILLWDLVIYVFASVFAAIQGRLTTRVVQRAVFRLREQVEAKLAQLPLSYFDKQARGEVLSRATNDMDNVSMTLQQTMSQLLFALFTVGCGWRPGPCRSVTYRRSSSTRGSSASRSPRSPAWPTWCSRASPRRNGSSSCSTRRSSIPTRSSRPGRRRYAGGWRSRACPSG